MSLITKISVNKDIKSFKKDLINECTTNRIVDPTVNGANNYFLNSKHTENLYTMLIRKCTKHLNTFTISDYNFKLWCYYSDNKFNTGNWNNHINTATINAVLYLKVPKNNGGIDFRYNQTIYNYKGVFVSGSHWVIEDNEFVAVEDSKHGVLTDKVEPVYTLKTSEHRMWINDIEFGDFETGSDDDWEPHFEAVRQKLNQALGKKREFNFGGK